MVKKKTKAGIVGSGFAAKFHYEALQRVFSADVIVTGAYSLSPQNLAAGYQHEKNAFYKSIDDGTPLASDSCLGADVIATIYTGYVSAEKKGQEMVIANL